MNKLGSQRKIAAAIFKIIFALSSENMLSPLLLRPDLLSKAPCCPTPTSEYVIPRSLDSLPMAGASNSDLWRSILLNECKEVRRMKEGSDQRLFGMPRTLRIRLSQIYIYAWVSFLVPTLWRFCSYYINFLANDFVDHVKSFQLDLRPFLINSLLSCSWPLLCGHACLNGSKPCRWWLECSIRLPFMRVRVWIILLKDVPIKRDEDQVILLLLWG